MNKIIVIVGPTGVGKTKLSIMLAKKYNGEIINADSMQIYKDLNIGTAKIIEEEKENIPHYLFDIKNVDEDYSIYDYQKDCRNAINEIILLFLRIIRYLCMAVDIIKFAIRILVNRGCHVLLNPSFGPNALKREIIFAKIAKFFGAKYSFFIHGWTKAYVEL